MRYVHQHKRNSLPQEKVDNFLEMLSFVSDHSDELNSTERTFVTDMYEKSEKYGKKLFVSEAQYEWLEKIAARVG